MKRNNITLIQLLIISHVAVLGAGIIGATGFKLLSFKFSTTTVFMSTCIVLMILQVIRPMRYVALIKARRQRDRAMLKAKELESQRIIVQNFNNMNIFGDNNGTIYGDNASHNETHYHFERNEKQTTAVTKSEQEVKTAIEEMLKEMGEDEKPLFRNKKQWWAVFRVLSKYLNYPNKMTEFVAKINNLNIEQEDRIAISYDSLSAAPKDVPQMSCSPDAWDTLKNKSENYMNQYAVAEYLMVRLGIKS